MIKRKFWIQKIADAWKERNVIWLSGVRRSGKTCLCQSLEDIVYFDCELPSVRHRIDDPESFLKEHSGKRLALDEIHRLKNPSELLKIAADHFQDTKIIATGSSSLSASTKFKDTLTGRKRNIWLTPATEEDMLDFNVMSLEKRLKDGGLPPFLLTKRPNEKDFQEWMDDYWAKDIQELFRVEKKSSFVKFVELLISQSAGIFEATKFAVPCEVSRPTIANYLSVLEASYVANVLRPFNSRKPIEIVAAPKVYFFDTGFYCCYKGWNELRSDDFGVLWEHFVLNELHAHLQHRKINYWRDKLGHEIDFVLVAKNQKIIAIECKWRYAEPEIASFRAFAKIYPESEFFIVCSNINESFKKIIGGICVTFTNIVSLLNYLQS